MVDFIEGGIDEQEREELKIELSRSSIRKETTSLRSLNCRWSNRFEKKSKRVIKMKEAEEELFTETEV